MPSTRYLYGMGGMSYDKWFDVNWRDYYRDHIVDADDRDVPYADWLDSLSPDPYDEIEWNDWFWDPDSLKDVPDDPVPDTSRTWRDAIESTMWRGLYRVANRFWARQRMREYEESRGTNDSMSYELPEEEPVRYGDNAIDWGIREIRVGLNDAGNYVFEVDEKTAEEIRERYATMNILVRGEDVPPLESFR